MNIAVSDSRRLLLITDLNYKDMKIYEYSRVSTQGQTLAQQQNKVNEYLANKGWTLTMSVADEGVSGGVSYKQRKLVALLDMMEEGDCLIVSEMSRLGRSMSDINKLVNDDLKPRKLRLIVVSMGIDLDCSRMKAIDELILQNFAFAAQVEKEMIQERTQSALDSIKHNIATKGYHVSKKGNTITHLGRPKSDKSDSDLEAARAKSNETNRAKAKSNENNIRFEKWLTLWESKHGVVDRHTDLMPILEEVNALGYTTSTGMPFNKQSLRQMIYRTKERKIS